MISKSKIVPFKKRALKQIDPARLEILKEFYNTVGHDDVIELALRILEMGALHDSAIFYFHDDDFYEITIL